MAAAPCYIRGGIYQLLYKCCSMPDPGLRYFTLVSPMASQEIKKTVKPAEVGGEPGAGEHPQLPPVPLRSHLSTRSDGADLIGASAFIFLLLRPTFSQQQSARAT